MSTNFNKSFWLIDFALLDIPEFLKFFGSSECLTYAMLRRHIWRQASEHHLGLHNYYVREGKLACSQNREELAEALGIGASQVSLHLSKLREWQVIDSVQTGRQSIFVLGEWVDVNGDGSYRGVEWFYLDRRFGISKSDVVKKQTSAVGKTRIQTSGKSREQSSAESRDQSVYKKETVNGNENGANANTVTVRDESSDILTGKHPVSRLGNLGRSREETKLFADEITRALGDEHSVRFYYLVASHVPETVIRQTMSEIKLNGAKNPPALFNDRMRRYAEEKLNNARAKPQNNTLRQFREQLIDKHTIKH